MSVPTIDSGPFANVTGEGPWSSLTSAIAPTGVLDDGTANDPLSGFADGGSPTSKIRPGRAGAAGLFFRRLTAVTSVEHLANGSGSPRTDTVVMRLDLQARSFAPFVVQGTPGVAAPPPPLLNGPEKFDVALYDVAIPARFRAGGATTVAAAWLAERRLIFRIGTLAPRGEIGYQQRTTDSGNVGSPAVAIGGTSVIRYIPTGRRIRVTGWAMLSNVTTPNTYVISGKLIILLNGAEFASGRRTIQGASVGPTRNAESVEAHRTFTSSAAYAPTGVYACQLAIEAPGGGLVQAGGGVTYPMSVQLEDLGAA